MVKYLESIQVETERLSRKKWSTISDFLESELEKWEVDEEKKRRKEKENSA